MMTTQSLPSAWTDRIWAKLMLTYGQRFLGLYSGIDLEAVKANWGKELRAYAGSPDAIAWALEKLPSDKPPTVLEFRELCRSAPAQQKKHIEAPWVQPNPVVLAKAAEVLKPREASDPKEWARKLQDRDKAGHKLTAAQRSFYREALGLDKGAAA